MISDGNNTALKFLSLLFSRKLIVFTVEERSYAPDKQPKGKYFDLNMLKWMNMT